MWKVTKERIRLHIRWIRGHSGDVENSIADRLADDWYTSGASASMVATDTVEWRLGRGGLHQKSCEKFREKRQRARKPSKPDGRAQQTSQGQTLHRTSLFRHWGR